jgi:hypothetical protein
VTLSPPQGQGLAGEAVTYTVSITNRDSNCPAAIFSAVATPPLGWLVGFSQSTLTIAAGGTLSTVLTVSSSGLAQPGTYAVEVAAVDVVAPTHATISSVSYTVTAAGFGAFGDDFDRPDATTLDNGWEPAGGGLFVSGGEARSLATATMHRAVQADLLGARQEVQARFAATDTQGGPRFGLYMRYQDSRNYYACYRQTGLASRLRLVRVINGTEHVLAGTSLKNPAKNRYFVLECRADGTTLTATLDNGKTIEADDGALGSGQVGFFVGYTKSVNAPQSLHVDDFAAFVE